ncbi:MAG: nitronate monooxygenase [Candidatus Moranbacteria bacterium]|nr:nitronate monooxygenase [Candidatus Moranbacteria bacterium]
MKLPQIIQGGMGVGVSGYLLARAVALSGGLGTVSGVVAPHILAHILQQGDPGGHYRRALSAFPFQSIAHNVFAKYFVEGGIPSETAYRTIPVFSLRLPRELVELTLCANFALVWLAKEGHNYPISINYLEKIQIPHLYSFFGAMLAGVNVVTMGAGIPFQVPSILDAFAQGQSANYRVAIEGSPGEAVFMEFDPEKFFDEKLPPLKRPAFLPIVSSDSLAKILLKKAKGTTIEGFVVELPTAGGHNAGPRGTPKRFNDQGEPLYGEADRVDFEELKKLGLPFWIGGSLGSSEGLAEALSLGAVGIQAGSIFALADESGLESKQKSHIRRQGYLGDLRVITSQWSPTGFPFKVVALPGTTSEDAVYQARKRICSMSYLITPFRRPDGIITSRCSAEPEKKFIHKGGDIKDTLGKRCLCQGLLASVGLGNPDEPQIFTLGDDVSFLRKLMADKNAAYTAADAMIYLTRGKQGE